MKKNVAAANKEPEKPAAKADVNKESPKKTDPAPKK